MNILVIGSGGREHAIIKKINESKHQNNIICIGTHINPGINKIAKLYTCNISNNEEIIEIINKNFNDNYFKFAIIGPETPLANGIVDLLLKKIYNV